MADDDYCTNCEKFSEFGFDFRSGDTICLQCGLILESRSIDDSSVRCNFPRETRGYYPSRVGSPVNPPPLSPATIVPKHVKIGRNLSSCRGHYEADKIVIVGFKTVSTNPDRPVYYKFGSNLENSIRARLCKHKRKREQ